MVALFLLGTLVHCWFLCKCKVFYDCSDAIGTEHDHMVILGDDIVHPHIVGLWLCMQHANILSRNCSFKVLAKDMLNH